MAKHIGIVACSAEGAALCYRTICAEAPLQMGEHMHPEISMHTHPLGEYMVHIRAGNWKDVAELMLSSSNKVFEIGANLLFAPTTLSIKRLNSSLKSRPYLGCILLKRWLKKPKRTDFQNLPSWEQNI